MSGTHGNHRKVVRDAHARAHYHPPMMHPHTESTRTLALELPETEWRALRSIEPNAVSWLQDVIKARITQPRAAAPAPAAGDVWWGDEY